jgi:hypothetical protein
MNIRPGITRFLVFIFCFVATQTRGNNSPVDLVGSWCSIYVSGGNSVSNICLYIYGVTPLNTSESSEPITEVDGQFWVTYADERVEALPNSIPIIISRDTIEVGAFGSTYIGAYRGSDATIVLEDKTKRLFTTVTLRRVSRNPGKHRVLPKSLTFAGRLHKTLVGIWQSRELSNNMTEFSGVTNVTFTVYGVGTVFSHAQDRMSAGLRVEFITDRDDGSRVHPAIPDWIIAEDDQLRFGFAPDSWGFAFSFEDNALVLERTDSTGGHFKSTFERMSRWPGKPPHLDSIE